jgi:hypothetical protein
MDYRNSSGDLYWITGVTIHLIFHENVKVAFRKRVFRFYANIQDYKWYSIILLFYLHLRKCEKTMCSVQLLPSVYHV